MTDDKDLEVTLTLGQLASFTKFIQEEEREECALICENMERNGAWITKAEAASAIRANRSLATTSATISNGVKK